MFRKMSALMIAASIFVSFEPARAQGDSESKRLEKLERAVERLQKRNTELEGEVRDLKNRLASGAEVDANGSQRPKADGKALFAKSIVTEEKPAVFVVQRGPEIKLTLGGFIQMNFEDGDVSAFEGRFGLTALKDRFRLRRARINLTAEFAEQFDFKMEGDFENSDGLNSNRTAFEATDIFINWHQFPWAKVKTGQWKAPFGLEQTTPDTTLYTIERTLPTGAITPERQIGIQLWGKPVAIIWPGQADLLTYYAGIFN